MGRTVQWKLRRARIRRPDSVILRHGFARHSQRPASIALRGVSIPGSLETAIEEDDVDPHVLA